MSSSSSAHTVAAQCKMATQTTSAKKQKHVQLIKAKLTNFSNTTILLSRIVFPKFTPGNFWD
jgi:hypothetical protein